MSDWRRCKVCDEPIVNDFMETEDCSCMPQYGNGWFFLFVIVLSVVLFSFST